MDGLIERAGRLSLDEAADLYHARATRLLLDAEANEQALATARRIAARTQRTPEYEKARRPPLRGAPHCPKSKGRGSWSVRRSRTRLVPWSSRTCWTAKRSDCS